MAVLNKSILNCNYSTERLFDYIRFGAAAETIQTLLQEGADGDARDSNGYTPLLLACLLNRKRIVDLLIISGVNVDVKCNSDLTVLHYASGKGWIETVRTLVERVPDLDARDIKGETALHHASRSGCLKAVKCLVEEGANVNMKNFDDFSPLIIAANEARIYVVNYLLLNSRTNVDGYEGLLLFYASRNGWTELVNSFVKRVPDLNECYEFGFTALHAASFLGRLEIINCLLDAGADINKKDDRGKTALHISSSISQVEVVKFLVTKGVDINIKDGEGDTALHIASSNEHLEVVRCLVEKGHHTNDCDLNARNNDGFTALGNACISQDFDIAQYLLRAGSSWDIIDKDGDSPLNYVTKLYMEEELKYKFIKLFIENGAYLELVDYEGIVKSSLKVLQDIELSCQAIVNKFNYCDLPKLYQLPASRSLPRIENMKIASGSEVAQAIKRTVEFDIQMKGHCNILEVRPMILSVFSVRSVLEYYEKKTMELRSCLKRPADSSNKWQHSSKVMRLS